MTAFYINLPPDVQAQITSAASQYSVDALVASAIAQVSSGGQQFAPDGSPTASPFGIGIMGVSKDVATSLGFDATTQEGNIQAGIVYLASFLQVFVGNYSLALSAYATSADAVQQFNGIPPLAPVQNFVYNVSTIAAQAGSYSVSALLTVRNESTLDPSRAASKTGVLVDTGGLIDPRVHGQQNINSEVLAATEPILQRDDATLQNTAWYADTGLVTGNPRIRASVQPVSFTVYFDRNDPTQYLRNPADSSPIEVQLNTSLTSFEIASKHVYNRTPSRTGMHVTLWGMEPDLISGSGTTGVFMNQFGLTDFMSVAGINDDIVKILTSGFSRSFQPEVNIMDESVAFQNETPDTQSFNLISTVQQLPSNAISVATVSGSNQTASNIIGRQNLSKPNEAFRVAAQDAFVELLKLFQMNGNVWFYSQEYASGGANGSNLGLMGQTQQESPTAWSSKTGTTSFQQHARNNDVMTRGYVSMRYRNNIYLGYFKQFSWTQDAESPFQWKFSFAFQVEKTYTALYFPQPSVQLTQTPGGGETLA